MVKTYNDKGKDWQTRQTDLVKRLQELESSGELETATFSTALSFAPDPYFNERRHNFLVLRGELDAQKEGSRSYSCYLNEEKKPVIRVSIPEMVLYELDPYPDLHLKEIRLLINPTQRPPGFYVSGPGNHGQRKAG